MKKLLFLTLPASLVVPLSAASLVSLWEFNDSSNLRKATLGADLQFVGSPTASQGVSAGDGAAFFNNNGSVNHYAIVTNPIGPNGGGTFNSNQFAIVVDFMIPSATMDRYTAFFDFDWDDARDANYFYDTNRGFGLAWPGLGYKPGAENVVSPDQWHRLVYSAENHDALFVYLDGALVGQYAGLDFADGDYTTIGSTFRFLWDDDGDVSPIHISNLGLYDGGLSATEVRLLGPAGSAIPEPATALLGSLGLLGLLRRRR